MVDARCRDLDYQQAMHLFFPDKGKNFRDAKRICLGIPPTGKFAGKPPCPVIDQCLKFALSFEPEGVDGIWAGTTPSERRKLFAQSVNPDDSPVRSYRNLDRLGDLVELVSKVNREADTIDP